MVLVPNMEENICASTEVLTCFDPSTSDQFLSRPVSEPVGFVSNWGMPQSCKSTWICWYLPMFFTQNNLRQSQEETNPLSEVDVVSPAVLIDPGGNGSEASNLIRFMWDLFDK